MMQKNIFKTLVLSAFIFTLMAGVSVFAYDAKAGTKTTFPASFDLRTEGHVSPVRDGTKPTETAKWDTSWAFAVMASLESTYLKAGGTGYPDYSEQFLAYYCYIDQDDTRLGFKKYDESKYPDTMKIGGDALKATALLSRWTGIVNETDAPYGSAVPSPSADITRYLKDVHYLSCDGDTTVLPIVSEDVKQALTTYGAVVACVFSEALGNPEYFKNSASYVPESSGKGTDNGNYYVAIVGWDDNYPKGNFNKDPGSDGAWIAKNSNGTTFGKDGYFYISYKDVVLSGGQVFVSAPADSYDYIYQHDIFGWNATYKPTNMTDDTAWFANVFTAGGAEAGSIQSLEAVSFYSAGVNSDYEISVYTGVTVSPTTGTKVLSQNGTIPAPGYYTVKLDEPQDLSENQKFSIVVKLIAPGVGAAVAIESNDNGKLEISEGKSFVSATGTSWSDMKGLDGVTGNACLKAFSKKRKLQTGKDITAFSIPSQESSAVIDSTAHTVTVTMPHDTNILSLVADFTLSGGASVEVESALQDSGATANNFISDVTYTVTAENGTTQNWVVTVVLAAAPPIDPDTPVDPVTPEVKPSDVSPFITKEDAVSSNSGAKPMSDQGTTGLINANDDLLKFFDEDKIATIIAVELSGGIKDIKIPVKAEHAPNVEDVVMEYDGSQTITPVIAQIKSNGSSDSMGKFDISLPSEQINSLMSSASEETLTFRFRVTTKESVIMFDGRNLVAEQLASIETKGELYYIVIAFSNNPEVGLTFNDLSGSVFKVGTLESGGDVSQGGGCSLGNFALAAILLILPLMFIGKKQNRSC